MFGGNDVYIWHHSHLVFHVYYQVALKECQVRVFKNGAWLATFKKLMRAPCKALSRLKRELKLIMKEDKLDAQDYDKQVELKKEAIRLGLLSP